MSHQIFPQSTTKDVFGYGDEQLYYIIKIGSEYKIVNEADVKNYAYALRMVCVFKGYILDPPIFKGTYQECVEELKKYE